MNNNNSFILLSRSLLDSEVFASQKLLKIWVWILIKVNYKDKFVPLKIGNGFTTVDVKRGQFVFGRKKAEEELFINGSSIYRAMKKLEKMDMIKMKTNNQFTIVEVNKYNEYQDFKNYEANNQRTTSEQPATQTRITSEQPANTTKQEYQDNNNKEINNTIFSKKAKKDIQWLESIERNNKKANKWIIEQISVFDDFLISQKKQHSNSLGYQSHFANWFPKHIERLTKERAKNKLSF